MVQIGKKLRSLQGGMVAFICPGCDEEHAITVDRSKSPSWGYNGNPEAPTFTPSILRKTGHHCSGHKPGDSCWCTYENAEGEGAPFTCNVCHSFVTDGRIRFLNDCTHELAGQTVDLPDVGGLGQ